MLAKLCGLRQPRSKSSQQSPEPPVLLAEASTAPVEVSILSTTIPSCIKADKEKHFSARATPVLASPICHSKTTSYRLTQKKEGAKALVSLKRSLPRRVCLFCYTSNAKNHIFTRKDYLRNHYRKTHFQYQVRSFICPVSDCSSLIEDPDRWMRHASSTHHSDLGVRASIMKQKPRQARPGQLLGFRL